jgi:hypothetical protein
VLNHFVMAQVFMKFQAKKIYRKQLNYIISLTITIDISIQSMTGNFNFIRNLLKDIMLLSPPIMENNNFYKNNSTVKLTKYSLFYQFILTQNKNLFKPISFLRSNQYNSRNLNKEKRFLFLPISRTNRSYSQ